MQRMAFIVLAGSLVGCMQQAEVPPQEEPAADGPAAPAAAQAQAPAGPTLSETAPGVDPSCPHGTVHGEGGCDGAMAAADPSKSHFGAEFTTDESLALASAVTSVDPAKTVRVTGTVDSVCQKMGCWMVLADGDKNARILMKDHAFTVPMDCKGRKAEVEGTLTAKTFTEDQVKHLEQDGGGDPGKVSGEREEYVLSATGVRLLDS